MYLPVNFEKSLMSVGDVHAAQSEGELGRSGIEISASLTLNINVSYGKYTNRVHLISENKITFFGFCETLEKAIQGGNNQALNCSNDGSDEKILSRLIIAQSVKINIVKPQQLVVAIELSLDLFK
ncbi:acetamidase/formamidase family protein [Serratia symbiotica]|nr:acetamidase/formamidase family protein [Serratia symbiotica]